MIHKWGLKIGSNQLNSIDELLQLYKKGVFQYIELFINPDSFESTVNYWKRLDIPYGIHAPHSLAGLNPSLKENRSDNKKKIEEVYKFADLLDANYVVFHPGLDGDINEVITQLKPFIDSRTLLENKPNEGLNGEKCIGANFGDLKFLLSNLNCGFCLDFGHAICAANSLKRSFEAYIDELLLLKPKVFHLTDGMLESTRDKHLHFGEGDYPIKKLLDLIPRGSMITNEAKRTLSYRLDEFSDDMKFIDNLSIQRHRKA